jgi:predicted glycosyl hydrolase (DUF1957 family)
LNLGNELKKYLKILIFEKKFRVLVKIYNYNNLISIMTIYFSLLLHIYQPPIQIPQVIKQVSKETYRPLIQSLKNYPEAKVTLNINATLTEQLDDYGFNDVITDLSLLAYNNQIEFTGSSKYHALLPLTPPSEIKRQIKLNEETNKYYFGKAYNPKGFFPPEMAVSSELFPIVKESGYDWLAMSAIGNPHTIFPTTTFHQTKEGLGIVFRDDKISNNISFGKTGVQDFLQMLKYRQTYDKATEDYYVIIAQDGETHGHHVKHSFETFINPLFTALAKTNEIKLVTISDLFEKFPKKDVIEPKSSSWSTDIGDLNYSAPLPLWFHPDNQIHMLQHKIIMKTISLVTTAQQWQYEASNEQKHYYHVARTLLDRGQHSCQLWWASKRPWYSPDMIIRGLNEIFLSAVNARRSLPTSARSTDIYQTFTSTIQELLTLQSEIIMKLE